MKYQLYVLIDFIYWLNFLVLLFYTSILFHSFYCSAPAAWIKVLSFGVCFKSVASFCHPQYLLRASPRSIACTWNSRIWHFHVNNTVLPRNVWNLVFATSRPESLTRQFRRFSARTVNSGREYDKKWKNGATMKLRTSGKRARDDTVAGHNVSRLFCVWCVCLWLCTCARRWR